MSKTACEEAADILCDDFIPARHYADDRRALQEREALAKRLRAEGRELLLYRKLANDISYGTDKRRIAATLALQVMASGLQKKARKAK